MHDRFIAYLATHAPLTKEGLVPPAEELRERWRTAEIVRLLGERFAELKDVVSFLSSFNALEFVAAGLSEKGIGGIWANREWEVEFC